MAVLHRYSINELDDQNTVLQQKKSDKTFTLTPYFVTFFEGTLTDIDIQTLLEAGLRVIRFKISHVAISDKLLLLSYLKKAIASYSEKHEYTSWPVAISIDLPNACIMTGYLKDEIGQSQIFFRKNRIVEVTCDRKCWNKCDENRIFIDDPYTFPTIRPGAEIYIKYGEIMMICTEVISKTSMKCKIDIAGYLESAQPVCIRGVRHMRPGFSKLDRRLLEFAKEYELDIITVHSIRVPVTVSKIRSYFKTGPIQPFVLCSVCEQQGLDNIDPIIEEADGILLERDFLSLSITNPSRMMAIQMYVAAKCREKNKPFFISGSILENTLKRGTITCNEISDISNAVMQGAGFVLRNYSSPARIITSMEILNELCQFNETLALKDDFWPICLKAEPPINAAHATIIACAIAARLTESYVVIVLTVTGSSAIQLAHMAPQAVVLAVTTNAAVSRRLQIYRGIVPILYTKDPGVKIEWHRDMNQRIKYAEQYGLKNDLLKYNQTYIVLRKATTSSAFCDQVGVWKVEVEHAKKYRITCPENYEKSTNL